MFAKIVMKDLPRFLLVACLAVVGFGTSLYATYSAHDDKPAQVADLPTSFISLFRLSLSLADLTFLHEKENYKILRVLIYLTYLVTSNVVLFHMIIAALTDTYSTISKQGLSFWRRSQAQEILMLENCLPFWVQLNYIRKNYSNLLVQEITSDRVFVQRKTFCQKLIDPKPCGAGCDDCKIDAENLHSHCRKMK